MTRVLVVEDDQALGTGLGYALRREGVCIQLAASLAEAQDALQSGVYPDLLLLDVLLPDGSGHTLCQAVRQGGFGGEVKPLPVIFLTACDNEAQIVMGLNGGGDDYLTKPFGMRELVARINAVLRRRAAAGPADGSGVVETGPIRLDSLRHSVCLAGRDVSLTATEFRLLHFLMRHPEQILSRSQLLEALWDEREEYVDDNTLSVHIRHLREKLEDDPARPERILTVRGVGYRLATPGRGD